VNAEAIVSISGATIRMKKRAEIGAYDEAAALRKAATEIHEDWKLLHQGSIGEVIAFLTS
jgi:hypothetical protein